MLAMAEVATDLTVREVAKAAETVLGRPVQVTPETDIARDLAVDSLASTSRFRWIVSRPSRPSVTSPT
jgi:hypothetical protein